MLDVAFLTDSGLKRDHNEDSILVDKKSATFIVADGMGGHKKGEIASKILIDTFLASPPYNAQVNLGQEDDTVVPSYSLEDELNHYIEIASQKMIAYSDENHTDGIMGTTIVGVKYIPNIQAWALFHLGDSRAYLFKDNSLLQLTIDHSKHEAMRQQNIDGSDGVSDLCSREELLLLIIQYKNNLDFLCTQIKNLVYTRGAKDNLSVIAILHK